MKGRFFAFLLTLGGLAAGEESAMEELLYQSCLDCHDEASAKGGVVLEELSLEPTEASADLWLKCLEQVERGFMPPARKSQPTPEEREAAVRDLEARLVGYFAKKEREPAMMRRLNRAEYGRTLRDVFRMELGSWEPGGEFPADQLSHGFASVGEELVTSNFLFQKQLAAAEEAVKRAVHFGEAPERVKREFRPPFDRTTKGQIYGDAAYYRKTLKEPQPFQAIYTRPHDLPKTGYHPLDELREGVAVSGRYRVRIQVEAKFRHSLDQSKFKRFPSMWDESEALRLALHTGTLRGIDPGNKEALEHALRHEQGGERRLALWDLPDDELVWLEAELWLDEGEFLRFTFPNGPTDSNNRLLTYFKDHSEDLLQGEALRRFQEGNFDNWNIFRHFESPRIHLHRIELEGPLFERWPPESHRVVFGEKEYASERAERVLQRFASRAWRRPVGVEEVGPILALVREAEAGGLSAEEAIQEGLKAVLCSPGFLFREVRGEELDAHELASRLAYFLTGAPPDETLRAAADAGEVDVRLEAERLLAGPGVDGFVADFLDGWLGLRLLGSMSPDPQKFRVYYSEELEAAMRRETRLFFKHLLAVNGRVEEFLDGDYVLVNRPLAELYGLDFDQEGARREIAGLGGEELRPDEAGEAPSQDFVRLPLTDRRRGGLLGQASVLTLTANGVDTSPILRGVWLLENLLGTPPSEPPPDIPVIEPDVRGATTIRDQVEKHRESSACASCHAHIDPPGFALESFDAIGKLRGHYVEGGKALAIDPSGEFGGREFADVAGFKDLLLERRDQFARHIVEKLFLHALGRELGVPDRPEVRRILEKNAAAGYPLRDLVLEVVESPLFRKK
ncbi:MAG: DUF1592 domain-containing protein [Verrucomicrobiales bacterium]